MKIPSLSRSLFYSALSILLCQVVSAQVVPPPAPDKIGLTLTTSSTASGEARLKGGDTSYKDVQINNTAWTLGQSLGLGEAGSVAFAVTYNQTEIDEGNRHHHKRDYSADRVPLPNELQALGASLEYSVKASKDWSFSAGIGAASHVAKHELLSKGWGVNSHIMGLYTWSPDLTFSVGVAYDSLAHDWKCVPVLGFEWKPSAKWSVAIGFPKTAVSYELLSCLTLGLAVSGDGGTYYIKEDPRPGVAPRSLADSKLEYSEARLGFQADWKINRTFALSGSVGHVLYREFKYIDRGYKLKSRDVVPFTSIALTVSL